MTENNYVKPQHTAFTDIIDGVAKNTETTQKAKNGFKISKCDVEKSANAVIAHLENLYSEFRRMEYSQIESTVRCRGLLLGIINQQLNHIPADIGKFKKPFVKPIPTDPNFQTPEQKEQLKGHHIFNNDEQAVS